MSDNNAAINEELTMFKDMVLRFMDQEILPHYSKWEDDHHMPREVWHTMGRAGMLLVDMPEPESVAS